MFNGVPDWVYEEEVFSSNYVLWWSPDSKNLAFLSLDETAVDEYIYPIYNPSEDSYKVVPYPDQISMKYPKPGYNNPLVTVNIFQVDEYLKNANHRGALRSASLELDWDGRQAPDNRIISEVAWVADSILLVREVNRAADNGTVALFDLTSTTPARGHVVRRLGKQGEQGDDGWIDSVRTDLPFVRGSTNDSLPF